MDKKSVFFQNGYMEGFIESFKPFLQKYAVESVLLVTALFLTIISISVYVYISNKDDEGIIKPETIRQIVTNEHKTLMVEVSGAIKNPGVYEFDVGSRLKDAIDKSQGLTETADITFFTRHFNLSRYLTDQEKIYVPSQEEITNDIFSSRKLLLDYTAPQAIALSSQQIFSQDTTSINTSTADELDALPSIGTATVTKIIQGRPYATLEELVSKKILKQSAFDQIKNLISL